MSSPNGVAVPVRVAEKEVFGKLKPGPGLSREAVAADQCLRLRTALCALAAESGYDAVTVWALIRRASVSTSSRTGLLRREELISRCATHIRAGASAAKRPSELVVDASISAIWRIAETEVTAGRTAQLPRVAPVFVYMLLASRRPRPPPPPPPSPDHAGRSCARSVRRRAAGPRSRTGQTPAMCEMPAQGA